MLYESLLHEAEQLGISTYEKPMPYTTKGLYADGVIWINRNIKTTAEKSCIVAEELGHYHTTVCNILDQSDQYNRKKEKLARNWAYQYLIPLSKIVQAYRAGIFGRHELAEYLDVTEDFLQAVVERYQEKFGLYTVYDKYTIYFDPLGVMETLDLD